METRLDREGFDKTCGDLPFLNKVIVKKSNSGGGLALLWKTHVHIDIINYTENHILAKVVKENGFAWTLTCYYGWPEASQKHKT